MKKQYTQDNINVDKEKLMYTPSLTFTKASFVWGITFSHIHSIFMKLCVYMHLHNGHLFFIG